MGSQSVILVVKGLYFIAPYFYKIERMILMHVIDGYFFDKERLILIRNTISRNKIDEIKRMARRGSISYKKGGASLMLQVISSGKKTIYKILESRVETLDGEAFIYAPKIEKVVALNKTATLIWEYITSCNNLNPVSTEAIADDIILKTSCDINLKLSIINDINSMIAQLTKEGILQEA